MPPIILLYCDGVAYRFLYAWLPCMLIGSYKQVLGNWLFGECKIDNVVKQYAVAVKNSKITVGLLPGILNTHIDILVLYMCVHCHWELTRSIS